MASIFNPSTHLFHFQIPTSHSPRKASFIHVSLKNPTTHDQKLVIVGGSKLSGHVSISGSKNSALPILAATLCCSGATKLQNIPQITDTRTMLCILRSLGVVVNVFDNGDVVVDTSGVFSLEPCSEEVGKIRAGIFVLGPLLARFGEAVIALPGGCRIGARPIDLFIRGLRTLGAIVELEQGKVRAYAANGKGLVGGTFHLDYPSVGATETLMMAASMSDGVTVLSNVAKEPEIVDLAQFLNDSGASVEGAGSGTLIINGRKQLYGSEYTIIPDRIEAGTFMIAAAITRSSFSMSPVIPWHLSSVIDKLSAAGCKVRQITPTNLEIAALPSMLGGNFQGFNVTTGPFPKFPTDLQPQIMALLTTMNGLSNVNETVFEGRMNHVGELQKLGARIIVSRSNALVYGKDQGSVLRGSNVAASDLRSGASLVLVGLAAEGITEIKGLMHIDRGYEDLELKLQCLGADIGRKPSNAPLLESSTVKISQVMPL